MQSLVKVGNLIQKKIALFVCFSKEKEHVIVFFQPVDKQIRKKSKIKYNKEAEDLQFPKSVILLLFILQKVIMV